MEMRAYQVEALVTDVLAPAAGADAAAALVVPMLGLAGEAGQLLSEYKKHLRDGDAHRLFKDRVSEELGDLLWYVANVASRFDLDLNEIAKSNLNKVQERWAAAGKVELAFDGACSEAERLPRQMDVVFTELRTGDQPMVQISVDGEPIGSPLGDNAYDSDGYRFHDVFHLAYAAILGWSPNLRAFLRRKRKSDPMLDAVEDGGRARILEEAIAALVFDYARSHNYLEGVTQVDYGLLRTIKSMISHLEVGRCSLADWEVAILKGFEVWRQVLVNCGGKVCIDLDCGTIFYTEVDSPFYHTDNEVPLRRNGARYGLPTIVTETNKPLRHAESVG